MHFDAFESCYFIVKWIGIGVYFIDYALKYDY